MIKTNQSATPKASEIEIKIADTLRAVRNDLKSYNLGSTEQNLKKLLLSCVSLQEAITNSSVADIPVEQQTDCLRQLNQVKMVMSADLRMNVGFFSQGIYKSGESCQDFVARQIKAIQDHLSASTYSSACHSLNVSAFAGITRS